MTTVYEKHAKDFSNVSAYVILNESNQKTGIITIKHPKKYDGELTVYLHLYGSKMQDLKVYGSDTYTISQAFKHLADEYISNNIENNPFKLSSDFQFCKAIIDDGFYFDTSCQTIANYSVMRAV